MSQRPLPTPNFNSNSNYQKIESSGGVKIEILDDKVTNGSLADAFR